MKSLKNFYSFNLIITKAFFEILPSINIAENSQNFLVIWGKLNEPKGIFIMNNNTFREFKDKIANKTKEVKKKVQSFNLKAKIKSFSENMKEIAEKYKK